MSGTSQTALPRWHADAFGGLGGRTKGLLLSHSFRCWQQQVLIWTDLHPNGTDGFWCDATIPGSGWCNHAQMCLFLMQIIHPCAVIFLCHVFASVSELLFIWDCYSGDVFTGHLCSVRWHLYMKRISTDKLVVWVMQPCGRIYYRFATKPLLCHS